MASVDGRSDIVAQKTIKGPINCSGIGLHSGAPVRMTLHPAEPDSGILFHRIDRGAAGLIPARWDKVVDTRLCTTLGNESGDRVATVEHLMAALAGVGIDNLRLELDGPEVPAMDGSAEPFLFLLECAGIVSQDRPRRAIEILKSVSAVESRRSATLIPDERFSVSFEIEFANDAVARQQLAVTLVNGTFKHEIARARTFGFAEEVSAMRAAGLALGGSLDNAIVIGEGRVLNEEGLRFEDEFVRHKMLDSIGDLYLAGAPILGHFRARCSGHALNHKVLCSLFADAGAWRWTTMTRGQVDHYPPVAVGA